MFGAFQLLLFFNHIPTIVDALIGQLVGEDGDDKERTQLLMRLTIPQSIAFAAGPFMAVQVRTNSRQLPINPSALGAVLTKPHPGVFTNAMRNPSLVDDFTDCYLRSAGTK